MTAGQPATLDGPWGTGTFRGFLSAVMLPIFIGVVLRLVSNVL
jgi:hypothetical protein